MTEKDCLVIVTPVYNDWESLSILCRQLDAVLGAAKIAYRVIAVDDASPMSGTAPVTAILKLTRNVGHQRAIAVGLYYAVHETDADMIAVMDADGEDRPQDLSRLIAAVTGTNDQIVVASRRRRSEGHRFRLFYIAYKITFRILTGEILDFGNFCVMRRAAAERLIGMHELWLNLPATIMRSRLETCRIPTDRGQRYAGQSRMNTVSLVTHGLSAIGVFSERAFTRVLLAIGSTAALTLVGAAASLVMKIAGLATPGWVTTITATSLIVLIQSALVALCGLFVVFGQTANLIHAPATTAQSLIAAVDRPSDSLASGTRGANLPVDSCD